MMKMMKRISTLLLAACFVLLMAAPAFALTGADLIDDNAYLLSNGEREKLEDYSYQLSEKNKTSICIVTASEIGGKDIREWEEQYFYDHEMGYGSSKNGLVLVIDMEDRQWNIMTFGDIDDVILNSECVAIGEEIRDDLSDSRYYDALHDYITLADQHLNLTDAEREYYRDLENQKDKKKHANPLACIGGSFIFSLLFARGSVGGMKRSMNTRMRQTGASEYLDHDSFHLATKRDIYLYRTVQKTAKPKEKESSGGSYHGHSSGGGNF